MHEWKVWAVVLPALALVACGQSSAPGSPSRSQPEPQRSALSFGQLLPAMAAVHDESLARCLAGSGDASCFGASVLPQHRITLTQIPNRTGLTTRDAGAADTVAPDAPTNLVGSVSRGATSSTVFLGWRAPAAGPAPTNYFLEAGSAPGQSDIAAFLTGSTFGSFSTTVSGSGTFYIRVRTVSGSAMSAPSNEIVLTLVDPAIPGSPFGVRVTANGSTVTLTWFAPTSGSPPTTYIIQASPTAGGAPTLANFATGNTATTLTATNVAPGTYFLRVLAANSAGVGQPSTEVSLILVGSGTCTAPPSAPSNLASLVSGSTVSLGWSAGSGSITSYVVEAGSATGRTDLGSVDTGSTAGSATFTGVAAGTYFVHVLAKNGCGLSGGSNEINVFVR
jgi:hypothetical protein